MDVGLDVDEVTETASSFHKSESFWNANFRVVLMELAVRPAKVYVFQQKA
jgi:hypothetical protein